MNSDEAVALGAAYVGVSRSNEMATARQVRMDPLCNADIRLLHGAKIVSIFNRTNHLGDSFPYRFKGWQNENISILADEPPTEIVKFQVVLPETASPNVTIAVDFGFDELALPGIYNVRLNRMEAQNVTFHPAKWALSKQLFNRSANFIKRMDVITGERRETQKAFNDFESFLYDTKQRLEFDDLIHTVTTPEELANLRNLTQENLDWLLNRTHKMPLTCRIIQDRAKQVNKTIQDVYFKAKELPKREPAFKELWNKIEECKKALNETWPITRPWMAEKRRNTMQSAIEHALKYYWIYREQQGNRSNVEMPGVRAHDVKMQTYYLELTYNHTLRITENPPTPKPPKTQSPYYKVYTGPEDFEADLQRSRERELFGDRTPD
jgi:hypothetical protein